MLSGYTVPPDSKETKVGSSNQEVFPLAGKNTGIVLVSCRAWWCGYFQGPWVSFVTTDEFSIGSQQFLQGFVSHELTAYLSIFNVFSTE